MSRVVVIAGPNGAGKSTCAPALLRGYYQVDEFVNADTIAQGLSAFAPERVAMEASRIMLTRLHELAEKQAEFGFETTLASRTFAPWLLALKSKGYEVCLIFLYLSNPDLAIARVRDRVNRGGHAVPEETVRRRYARGLLNFFKVYRQFVDRWQLIDNTIVERRILIASASGRTEKVAEKKVWHELVETYANGQ